MRHIYLLLPDGREPSGSVLSAFKVVGEGSLTRMFEEGIWRLDCDLESDKVLALLSGIDWHKPILVAFRAPRENRWSYATIAGSNRVAEE